MPPPCPVQLCPCGQSRLNCGTAAHIAHPRSKLVPLGFSVDTLAHQGYKTSANVLCSRVHQAHIPLQDTQRTPIFEIFFGHFCKLTFLLVIPTFCCNLSLHALAHIWPWRRDREKNEIIASQRFFSHIFYTSQDNGNLHSKYEINIF